MKRRASNTPPRPAVQGFPNLGPEAAPIVAMALRAEALASDVAAAGVGGPPGLGDTGDLAADLAVALWTHAVDIRLLAARKKRRAGA